MGAHLVETQQPTPKIEPLKPAKPPRPELSRRSLVAQSLVSMAIFAAGQVGRYHIADDYGLISTRLSRYLLGVWGALIVLGLSYFNYRRHGHHFLDLRTPLEKTIAVVIVIAIISAVLYDVAAAH